MREILSAIFLCSKSKINKIIKLKMVQIVWRISEYQSKS